MKLGACTILATAAATAAAFASACGGPAAPVVHAVTRGQLPANAVPTGRYGTIIELGDAMVVLGEHRVTVLRGGVISVAVDTTQAWVGATTIAAPDGEGRWAVGVADDGTLWRITLAGEVESVADRLGLGNARTQMLAGAGPTTAATIDGGIAATIDGLHLARIDHAAPVAFAVARGRLALSSRTSTEVWDLARGTAVTYPIAAFRLAFLDAASESPRLVADRDQEIYVETRGTLQLLRGPTGINQIVVSGGRLWIHTRGPLWEYDGQKLAIVVGDGAIQTGGTMVPASGGDVWFTTGTSATRYGIDLGGSIADTAWQAQIAPVFSRVCAHCHLPGGDAGVDLSTPASWVADRDELRRRVLVTQTMPPAGTLLTDDDRAAITAWLGTPSTPEPAAATTGR